MGAARVGAGIDQGELVAQVLNSVPDGPVDLKIPATKQVHRRLREDHGFSDGRHYAWEWTTTGTTLGKMLSYRGASVGTLDDRGRIVENRDYWNPKDIPGIRG